VIGFLMENDETAAVAALNRLDIAKLNEAMTIFTQFIKCVKRNFISYFNIFSMLQKPLTNLGFLRASKHTKTFIQAVPWRFS
jgi:hypothetical protein